MAQERRVRCDAGAPALAVTASSDELPERGVVSLPAAVSAVDERTIATDGIV